MSFEEAFLNYYLNSKFIYMAFFLTIIGALLKFGEYCYLKNDYHVAEDFFPSILITPIIIIILFFLFMALWDSLSKADKEVKAYNQQNMETTE